MKRETLFYCLRSLQEWLNAPGVMVIGLIISCVSFVIAVFAAVLQKLLKNAVDIKSENDLTV